MEKLKKGKTEILQVNENLIRIKGSHRLLSQIKHLEQVTNQLRNERLAHINHIQPYPKK